MTIIERLRNIRTATTDEAADLIEELEKDKERLDWVQSNAIELASNRHGQWLALSPMFPESSALAGKGNSIRQTIDDAMNTVTKEKL